MDRPTERVIDENGEKITILTFQDEEFLNMSNAWKYVGWSKPVVDQRILEEERKGKMQRRKMPGKTGRYVKRADLDKLRKIMNEPELIQPDISRKEQEEA